MSDFEAALAALRARMDATDDALARLIAERIEIARALGRLKAEVGRVGPDPAREAAVIARLGGALDPRDVAPIWRALFAASRRAQAEDEG